MDIEIRKQLEQLEYIKDKLEYIEYDEALGCYIEKQDGLPTGVAAWANGAFYGFEQAAKAHQAEKLKGCVVVPKDQTEDWYLDDNANMWITEPDEWLCDLYVGEVQSVEHKEYLITKSDTLYAAIVWDDENQDSGTWEFFKTEEEAEKAAAHCKAMLEAARGGNE